MTENEPSIEVALAGVHDARAILKQVEDEYEAANRRRTTAINLVNNAQKAFDEACLTLRKTAHRHSDWATAKNQSGHAE